jgi:hypothetical protein
MEERAVRHPAKTGVQTRFEKNIKVISLPRE